MSNKLHWKYSDCNLFLPHIVFVKFTQMKNCTNAKTLAKTKIEIKMQYGFSSRRVVIKEVPKKQWMNYITLGKSTVKFKMCSTCCNE